MLMFSPTSRPRLDTTKPLEDDPLSFRTAPSSLEKSLQVWTQVFKRKREGQSQRSSPPAEERKLPRNQKDEGGDWSKNRRSSGTCIDVVYKNRPTRVHLVAELGVFWPASALLSFLPSSEPLHLRHLNMSFAGARHFVASNNTFYEAKTVSGMFSHQAS